MEGDLPPLSAFAGKGFKGDGDGKKKKKSIVRIPDQFYFQYFTSSHLYSYFKVRVEATFDSVHVTSIKI